MADNNDGGDKTEKPTPKRLLDARKKGDVPKSRDVSSTAGLAAWLLLFALASGLAAEHLAGLTLGLLDTLRAGWAPGRFGALAATLGWQATELLLWLSALFLLPAAAVGLLAEFLQAGPVLAFEKLSPKLSHLNPAEGVKRMFSLDNLIELAKGLVKTALLFAVGFWVARAAWPALMGLPGSTAPVAEAFSRLSWQLTVQLLAWTLAIFALLALLDAVYQRWSFTKKMRMSLRDIRQEMKESEGDPHIKQQRKQAHAEWSQRNAAAAAGSANALVVNPTHVAIAIDYDRERCPVPTITAKGEDHVARAMREAAEAAGVPVVRNVPLARDMLARGEVGRIIPPDLFQVIAEVVLWAREVREQLDHEAACVAATERGDAAPPPPPPRQRAAPGEDLTRYAGDDDPLRGRAAAAGAGA